MQISNAQIKNPLISLVLVALALGVSGCLGAGNMKSVRTGLMDQLPEAKFERQFGIYIGSVTVGAARMVAGLLDDDDVREASDYLRNVKRVRVSVYNVTGDFSLDHVATPKPLSDMKRGGWEMAVKVREEDSLNWIMYKDRRNEIRDMYVVTLTDDEFVMVRAQGNFTRLIQDAIANETVPDDMFSWR